MTIGSLPDGWVMTTLGDLCLQPQYGWTTKATANEGKAKLLRTTDISRGRLEWETVPYCAKEPKELVKYLLEEGDIVISRAGSVGLSALIGPCPEAVFASYLIRFRRMDGVDEKYLYQFLQSPEYWEQVSQQTVGIALQNVNAKKLARVSLPFPPPAEQCRIVAEIERHFSRLDASVAALKRVQANLKRYRASVLKDACEGRLVPTEADLARAGGRDYEPADILLKRIRVERRTRWESQAKRRGKFKEPAVPDTSNLPDLPGGWVWATVDQLAEIKGGIQKQPKRAPAANPFPFLRVANVLRGRLNLNEVHRIELFSGELDKLRLLAGDLLIVEGNGSPTQIGRMAIWKGEIEDCVHQNHIIRARLYDGLLPQYVESYWNSPMGASEVSKVASSTSGLYTLSVRKVSYLPVPLAPLTEQHRIVVEVERRLSVIQKTEDSVEANLTRADRLRQSILKQAFSGKLVPQDPNDEPASVLLERIRAERAEAQAKSKTKKRTKRRRAKSSSQRQPGLGVQEKTS